jgi:thioredoxin 1
MKRQYIQPLTMVFILLTIIGISAYAQTAAVNSNTKTSEKTIVQGTAKLDKYKVTFIELGSVRCIPCQKMQPVMKSIEKKYGKQVKVVFHDIWTPEGKPFAQIFGIESIPTQVFIDENGKEFYRHVGYFPEEELVKILKTKGVKQNN